ncbi:MAG: type III glutamate--ammonia ligase [Methyloceanibacter sp.]|uniref:type III glutamate--ammonia ligase n=1 Tax=Methyloceanibacter sp. TaxID=1965321 RepID=UPI001D58D709|nr:type III glutamate--ammonia ligase [Methyloceanibacter sp.]MCB1441704.1 type III glutamate--ammonia ligase [Methyloceanibacter sp.]MCC0059018.1 type III glutamate--ammonia ligase [Hyphomicrobiaceae bacterium]
MAIDLAAEARDRGIKYFLISFVDLFGTLRAKLAPASAIADMAEDGAGFAGFASWLDMTPADPDMLAIPDPESLIQLPWKPEVGWLAADPYMHGKPVEQAPRNALKRMLKKAEDMGYSLKSGVECEYFLVSADGEALSDPADTQSKPCYDQSALMRRYDVVKEICDSMIELGWGPYQNDHEDANGQFEMNWGFDDALKTADRMVFFKYMTKTIAENHGLRATFMPKPFTHLTGNGCHMHISMWEGDKNVFADKSDGLGLSKDAYHFIGGLIDHADAICSITNPTVNSYKRINAPRTTSGATWSPNTVTYAGNNRTHMIRVPGGGRFEFRLADGATNAYLFPAAVFAAGLDGMAQKTDPGAPLEIDMYADGHKLPDGMKKLPLNLLDALRATNDSAMLRRELGDELVDAYVKLKMSNWNDFSRHLTSWERAETLDC